MNRQIQKSLQALVAYLRDDELKHWLEAGEPEGHIFRDVQRVAEWLDAAEGDLWERAEATARHIIQRSAIPDTPENQRWLQHEIVDTLLPLA